MQLNRDYEPEINLRDMFFHVLYRWRSVLLISLIGAVLFCGYKYISMNKAATSAQVAQTGEIKQELNRAIEEKAKQVEELETYLTESKYIKFNQYGLWEASCKYLMKTEGQESENRQNAVTDQVDMILPYYSYLLSNVTEEELSETFGISKAEYANELVNTNISAEENTISVVVKGETKEAAQRGLEFVRKKIIDRTSELSKTSNIMLIDLGGDIIFTVDKSLAARHYELKNSLTQDKKELQELRESAESDGANGGTKQIRKETIKFFLIGFLIGLFLSVCVYLFHYVLCGKLTSGKALSEQYNIPLFGEFVKSSSIHNNRGFDKIISKWELAKNKQNKEKIYDNISSLIAGQQQTDKILLVSTLNEDKLDPVKEALISRIEGIVIETKSVFPADSKAITETANAAEVILVEEKNHSKNKNIEHMAETLMINRANVIGAIVL